MPYLWREMWTPFFAAKALFRSSTVLPASSPLTMTRPDRDWTLILTISSDTTAGARDAPKNLFVLCMLTIFASPRGP